MEINARVRELYAERRGVLFIKALRDEFGLSIAEAKEILIKLDYGEDWTLNRYQERVFLPGLEALESEDELGDFYVFPSP